MSNLRKLIDKLDSLMEDAPVFKEGDKIITNDGKIGILDYYKNNMKCWVANNPETKKDFFADDGNFKLYTEQKPDLTPKPIQNKTIVGFKVGDQVMVNNIKGTLRTNRYPNGDLLPNDSWQVNLTNGTTKTFPSNLLRKI